MITPLIGLLALGVGAVGFFMFGGTHNEAWLLLIGAGVVVEDVLNHLANSDVSPENGHPGLGA